MGSFDDVRHDNYSRFDYGGESNSPTEPTIFRSTRLVYVEQKNTLLRSKERLTTNTE